MALGDHFPVAATLRAAGDAGRKMRREQDRAKKSGGVPPQKQAQKRCADSYRGKVWDNAASLFERSYKSML